MEESYYSCLIFLFTGKLPPATPGLRHAYKAVTSKLPPKNVKSKKTNFKVLLQ